MQNKQDSTYTEVSRSNAVFGGVKVLQMVVSFLRTKVVALCLGPAGVGVISLLENTVNTIYNFTNLGTAQSGVRAISIEKDYLGKIRAVRVIEFLSFVLGLLGALICFLFANKLSLWVFGEASFKLAFQIVSVAIFFISMQNGQVALFQGYHAVKPLAKASLVASVAMFGVTVPIVYFGGSSSIPYLLICSHGAGFLAYFLFRYKKLPRWKKLELRDSLKESKSTISLGVALMLSNSLMSVFALLLTSFINRTGSSSDVGLYQAANTCTYIVITILISILASDFYPRISSVTDDKQKVSNLLSAQVELLILILVPIVLSMVLFPSIYVLLFYSNAFIEVVDAVRLMGVSLLFRIVWHSFSYVILSRGDKIMYFVCDALIGNGLFFLGNLFGYKFMGVNGIAISYVFLSAFIMFMLGLTVKIRYNIYINSQIIKRVLPLFLACVFIYLLEHFKIIGFYFLLLFFIVVSIFCIKKYNDYTNLFSSIKQRIIKK